jgi:D-arabinose 1-dehydrogenase-like Zn-dependent alcohol dehydrogenase
MRAVVITAPRTCEVRLVERPIPAPDQILVRLDGCGVCGSNLPLWEGRPWFNYPAAPGNPGHEGWGKVVAVGANVRHVREHQRVALLSERAFAEYDVADASSVMPLPAALDGTDVPGEPLGCVMNIVRRAAAKPGETVAIIGLGFLGALVTQVLSRSGVRVLAISQRAYSRTLAARLGMTWSTSR